MQVHNPADVVFTPDWCASDIVKWFQPSGRLLEPCAGDGAFLRYMPGADWCEITKGRDFFRWSEPVDWIITNPPYSVLREFVLHGFKVSMNGVYLVPLKNLFVAHGFMADCWQYGWLKHVRVYGTGSRLGFPMGNAVGAMHFERGYWGATSWSWYRHSAPNNQFQPTGGILPVNGNLLTSEGDLALEVQPGPPPVG
jgi:hypothetical protein